MRGKVAPAVVFVQRVGITPAYAGKSESKQGQQGLYQDHPRLCGEKLTRSGVCGII